MRAKLWKLYCEGKVVLELPETATDQRNRDYNQRRMEKHHKKPCQWQLEGECEVMNP